jgi:hypothetical protein
MIIACVLVHVHGLTIFRSSSPGERRGVDAVRVGVLVVAWAVDHRPRRSAFAFWLQCSA